MWVHRTMCAVSLKTDAWVGGVCVCVHECVDVRMCLLHCGNIPPSEWLPGANVKLIARNVVKTVTMQSHFTQIHSHPILCVRYFLHNKRYVHVLFHTNKSLSFSVFISHLTLCHPLFPFYSVLVFGSCFFFHLQKLNKSANHFTGPCINRHELGPLILAAFKWEMLYKHAAPSSALIPFCFFFLSVILFVTGSNECVVTATKTRRNILFLLSPWDGSRCVCSSL